MSGIRESVQYDGLSVQMMENTTSEREKVIVSVLLYSTLYILRIVPLLLYYIFFTVYDLFLGACACIN